MLELRECSLLRCKSFATRGREPRIPQDLHRCLASQVSSLGEVDDSHSAFAEDTGYMVCTELPMGDLRSVVRDQMARKAADVFAKYFRRQAICFDHREYFRD